VCNERDTRQIETLLQITIIKGDTMSDTILTKQQSQTGTLDQTKSSVSTEIDKVIIGSIAAFAGIVGLWSVACLMSAMFQAGGPLNLAAGYFKALAGM
jgi:hypothetical protein